MAFARKINRVRNLVTFGILGLLGLIVGLLYYQLYNLKEDLNRRWRSQKITPEIRTKN